MNAVLLRKLLARMTSARIALAVGVTALGLLASGCEMVEAVNWAATDTVKGIDERYGPGTFSRATQNKVQCPICRGNGECRDCQGSGCVKCTSSGASGRCWSCKGSGEVAASE